MPSTPTASAEFVPADEHIVRHLLDSIPQRHASRANLLREEIRATVAHCLDLVASDRAEHPARMDRILTAATRWACVGIPLDTVQHLVHAGFRLYLDDHLQGSARTLRHKDIRRIFDVLHAVMATVSLAYLSIAPGAEQAAPHAVAAALLGGQHTAKVYREHGFPVADRYSVLAVAVGEHGEKHPIRHGGDGHALRQRMRICLAVQCGRHVPSLLSVIGGTILVPVSLLAENALDDLVAALATATSAPITAAAVAADQDRLPDAADQAHELLDMVQRLQSPPGLYRFDDLALEYQLTRPGPGRERLAALLDPLDDHPELVQTLREHIRNDFNRQRTSRAMYLHPNTVDHRLKRIGRLTGLDTALPHALYRLRAAFIARSYAQPTSMRTP
ncbi:helix-turn-helix domain-containing protein [Nocardia amamiensis]|uniref:Helix-turn-helix domain-containing protein n=1 Tax=Nocardia amamiensis TaxID=404578 RepID=A0ABS0CQC3_9NOCA|nr:helix-turn-helix domain-containing protein [Nocardia amamiensis]MBF6298819.1 helix-turn-helix domain-containing protein [Nocardia amamiensis]